jgi:tetratricopeptide (TPR) repeat protein
MIQMRKLAGVIVATLVFGQLPAQAATPLTSDQYRTLIQELAARPGGSFEAAVAQARRQTGNSDAQAQINLGMALSSMKAYPEAVEVLTRATELAPRDGAAFRRLGVAAFWSGNCDIALPSLERALALPITPREPDETAAYWHSLAGRCALLKGSASRAVEHCKTAAALAPTDPRGDFCLGKAQLQSRNFEAALAAFMKIALRPESELGRLASPYQGRSRTFAMVALHGLGRLDEAPALLHLDPQLWPREELLQAVEWQKTREQQNLSPNSWQE